MSRPQKHVCTENVVFNELMQFTYIRLCCETFIIVVPVLCIVVVLIPAVRLACIACFRRFLSQFSTDFDEILQGLFSSHAATAVKFSLKNII